MTYVRRNDQIRDMLIGDRGGSIKDNQVAGLFRIPKLLVPGFQGNTFAETETKNGSAAMTDAWGNHIWLAKVNPMAGMRTDTWLNAFRWTSPLLGTPWAVRRFPYDNKRGKFELDVQYYQDEKVISPDLAIRVHSLV